MLIDSTGVFWVGTWTMGIGKLDFGTFQFQRHLQIAGKDHVSNPDILDINQDSKGNIWLGSYSNSGILLFKLTAIFLDLLKNK